MFGFFNERKVIEQVGDYLEQCDSLYLLKNPMFLQNLFIHVKNGRTIISYVEEYIYLQKRVF